MIIFKPYDDDTFTCHSHECVRVIDLPEMGGELLISIPVSGFEPVPADEPKVKANEWRNDAVEIPLDRVRRIKQMLTNPRDWANGERQDMAQTLKMHIHQAERANEARARLAADYPCQEARCNRCGASKGLHAVGESCNTNCGGRVVAN